MSVATFVSYFGMEINVSNVSLFLLLMTQFDVFFYMQMFCIYLILFKKQMLHQISMSLQYVGIEPNNNLDPRKILCFREIYTYNSTGCYTG